MAELLPDGYAETLQAAKTAIGAARTRAVLAVDRELLQLYWTLGQLILERQQAEGWGTRVINRLSADLQCEFPGMTGLSPRNLMYMRQLAASWPDGPIAPQLVAQLPWGHNRELLDRVADLEVHVLRRGSDRAWVVASRAREPDPVRYRARSISTATSWVTAARRSRCYLSLRKSHVSTR
mgnify:CR=1 FL=1